ncbi:response regulator transcription factor [Crossiella sp. CA-258035]|uniref:LuxR C-terminal-related transcriptional regulator n=1 Tax=Crossiella sp. CA-258035 TaxID=2981138 RepID=UPI0024BCB60C|nr:response regulator transcription factor [Crossiella sp. CA-258035]WHT17534.1 response regulator transcription factor [Crossiella sp. CA-258035]
MSPLLSNLVWTSCRSTQRHKQAELKIQKSIQCHYIEYASLRNPWRRPCVPEVSMAVQADVRVFVIDPQPIVIATLRTVFAGTGDIAQVGGATSWRTAYPQFSRCPPDVVLLELATTLDDGLELIRHFREYHPGTEVLVFSAEGRRVLCALRAGARGFLLKSTGRVQLIEAVRRARAGIATVSPELLCQLVAEVQQDGSRPKLSARELEVLRLVAAGHRNTDIARDLFVTEATVKSHLQRLFTKLKVNDRAGAVRAATAAGLLCAGGLNR